MYVPTICLVEIVYLTEKGRIPVNLSTQLQAELLANSNNLVASALTEEVVEALSRIPRQKVPDMPDRIIAATALHLGLPLISKDRKVQTAEIEVLW